MDVIVDALRSLHCEPRSSPVPDARPVICPHCWMVNPGPFRLCGRCGADMRTHLQESGGLRRTAPVQSPVPVSGGAPLSLVQRIVVGCFLGLLALSYVLAAAAPRSASGGPSRPVPAETSSP